MVAELGRDVGPEVGVVGRAAGDDQAGRDREQQRRDLGDESVADRQDAVGVDGVGHRQVVLDDADGEAADEVDEGDDERGDRVATDELAGAVHVPVELGRLVDLLAPSPRLVLVDQAGVQLAVDRDQLRGHRVEGEPGRDLRHPAGAARDDDELDDDQDQEDDDADDDRAADDEAAEALDDRSGVAVEQHEPGDADVQREPEHRGHEQQRREDREVHRLPDVHRREQDDQGRRHVQRDQHVEQERRHRDDEHHDDADDDRGDAEEPHPLLQVHALPRHCGPTGSRPFRGRCYRPAVLARALFVSADRYETLSPGDDTTVRCSDYE